MHVCSSKSKLSHSDKEIPHQKVEETSIDRAKKFGTDSGPVTMSAFNALVECASNLRPRGIITANTFARTPHRTII